MKEEFITRKQLYDMLPTGINQTKKLFNQIKERFIEDGNKMFITRPEALPKSYINKYLREEKLI